MKFKLTNYVVFAKIGQEPFIDKCPNLICNLSSDFINSLVVEGFVDYTSPREKVFIFIKDKYLSGSFDISVLGELTNAYFTFMKIGNDEI
jgi:hypothetical protein